MFSDVHKTFTIRWKDAGEEGQPIWLAFVFSPEVEGGKLLQYHPVVFEAVAVRNSGCRKFTFAGGFAFGLCIGDKENLLDQVYRGVSEQTKTLDLSLRKDVPTWVAGTASGPLDRVATTNRTLSTQEITFGLLSESGDYMPLLSFEALPPGKSIELREPITVRVYTGASMQRGAVDYWISASTAIWESDLDVLPQEIKVEYTRDEEGNISLKEAESPSVEGQHLAPVLNAAFGEEPDVLAIKSE